MNARRFLVALAAAAALRFFDWAFSNGDQTATSLGYVPMPPA